MSGEGSLSRGAGSDELRQDSGDEEVVENEYELLQRATIAHNRTYLDPLEETAKEF